MHFNNATNVAVHGLRFVGVGTEHNGASTSFNGVAAVFFTGCTNVSVVDCNIEGHAGGGIRWTGALNGARFIGNRITGIGTAGGIVTGDNNSDVAIGGYSSTGDGLVVADNVISKHCFGIGATLTNGVTKEEIGELITHMAFYSGWPTAMTAARIAKGVFEERR